MLRHVMVKGVCCQVRRPNSCPLTLHTQVMACTQSALMTAFMHTLIHTKSTNRLKRSKTNYKDLKAIWSEENKENTLRDSYMVKMFPLVSPFPLCQTVVHQLILVASIQTYQKKEITFKEYRATE